MRKIFLTFAFTTVIFCAKAQVNQKNTITELASSTHKTTTEDPHNPLVNGIPYDQYKLQVQAENKRRAEAETKAKAKAEIKAETDKMSAVKLPPIDDQQNGQKSTPATTTGVKK